MNEPIYQKIYSQIMMNINSGVFKPGDKLPSEKELAAEFSVSRITSKKAFDMLSERGYIYRIPGKGSYIKSGVKAAGPAVFEGEERRRYKVGIVFDELSDIFGSRLLFTVESCAENYGYYLIPRMAYGSRDMEEKAIQSLLDFGIDGLILMTTHSEDINPTLLKLVIDKVPLVLVDRYLRAIPAPFVGTDNTGVTTRATNYLLELGHRNISFLTRPYVNTTSLEARIEGFVRSHAGHGAAIDESNWVTNIESVITGCMTEETIKNDINKIKELVVKNKNITCFFAAEYKIGIIAKMAVEELGLSVPEDISIITFDGPSDLLNNSFFTRIVQREEEIGRKTVELIKGQIEDHIDNSAQKIFCDADIIIGSSTAAPRLSP